MGPGKYRFSTRIPTLANAPLAKYETTAMTSCEILIRLPVMERDRRLTGFVRGQTDKPEAPKGFELNNPWRVRIPFT